jgi:hypothetical protein
VSFHFDSGHLAAVMLRPARQSDDAAPMFDELVKQLTSAHGKLTAHREQSSGSGSWERRASWSTPVSEIELRAWRTTLRDSHMLSLDFGSGKIKPLDESSVLLTYRRGRSQPR